MAQDAPLDLIRREDFLPRCESSDGHHDVSGSLSISERDSLPAPAASQQQGDDNASAEFPDYANASTPPEAAEIKYRGGITTHFPALLHAMLTKAECDGYSDIACWTSHGRSFIVHNRTRFVQEVMPLYFRQSQFASFQRQCNLYGFRRMSQKLSSGVGGYYHPMFLRTRQDLCPAIQRATEKEMRANKEKHKNYPDPNFNKMRPMPQANREHIEIAANITIPQRKCSNSLAPPPPSKTNSSTKPCTATTSTSSWVPPPAALTALSEPDDTAVASAYASLFTNTNNNTGTGEPDQDLDLSWMEPRPIAPEVIPRLRNNSDPQRNNPSTLDKSLDDSSFALSWMDPLAESSSSKKRSLPSAGNDPFSTEDPNMTAFLQELDFEPRSEDLLAPPPPPTKRRNVLRQGQSVPKVQVRSAPEHSVSSSAIPVLMKPDLSPDDPKDTKLGKLPRNFEQISKFPPNESLLITKAASPFTIIHANVFLEQNCWGMKPNELLDLPFLRFCANGKEHSRLVHAGFAVVQSNGTQQDVENLALNVGGKKGKVSYKNIRVGPFYQSDDPCQINQPRFLLWHLL